MELVIVYITAPSSEEARSLARMLVEERLAACVNIIGGVTSVYRWNGAIEEAGEVSMLVKTAADRFDALVARVRELHSYRTPCALELTIRRGDAGYLRWLEDALSADPTAEPT